MSAASDARGPHDPADVLARLADASAVLAGSADDAALYAAVQDALAALAGFRLLTVLRTTPAGDGLERMHTSDLAAYPAGGVKPVGGDAWLQCLLTASEPQLSPDADAVRRRFFDADAVFALGCQSALNVPVRFRGRTLGTLNLLHRAGWYRPSDSATCQLFANLIGAAWAAGQAAATRPAPTLQTL
ncbi:GAF domain-containing protein [Xylophilus sp. Leaf220]|uniref:GAF domain-containing protein n=1 Tax=Xylophilus sp. Leaf220 TaxID=1735686 RepID=UPI0006F5ACC4|nr:GAF domain-containing protein [Xylophilus sp. Leaf220]KQM69738.1 hypothetical protein ASE76_11340 [Xylophilus sp. Leaf220]